jgi:hypothetical protein
MSIADLLFGRPLKSSEERGQKLGPVAGVAVFGLDALSSAAYGPEAALTLLIPLGATGVPYIVPISASIIVLLLIVYFSYCQTIEAYPSGGGSYTVARKNLGVSAGLLAAAALRPPQLVVLDSPCRYIITPILEYVLAVERKNPDREIAVLVPELVVQRWYHYFLHNRAARLKALLLLKGNQRIIVIDVPWYLSAESRGRKNRGQTSEVRGQQGKDVRGEACSRKGQGAKGREKRKG